MSNESPTTPLSAESILHGRLDQIISTLAGVNTKVDTVIGGQLEHSAELGSLKQRVAVLEEARKNDSMPAKVVRVTDNDAKQDAAIAQVITDVAAVKADVATVQAVQAKQLAILERLDKVAANPMVRRVAYAIGAAILAYLGARGIKVLP